MKATFYGACGFFLNFVITFPLSADIPMGERAALIDLYQATGGDNWKSNLGWLGDPGGEGEWYGVSVSGDHVTRLRLTNNNLAGSLPASLADLTHLEELDLTQNQLSGMIPTSLGNLYLLETLSLARNAFTGTIPEELGNLTGLTDLDLRENQLTGLVPSALGNLGALTDLNLAQNQLTGELPGTFNGLAGLQRLFLSRNAFQGPLPIHLSALPALTYVDLSHNQFSGHLSPGIGGFQGFHTVLLTGNLLEGPIPDEVRQLEGVRLNIDWNMLYTTDASLADFLQGLLKPSGPDWEEFQITSPEFLSVGTVLGMVMVELEASSCRNQVGERGGYYLLSYGPDPGGPYPFQALSTTLDTGVLVRNLSPDETIYGILQTVVEPIPGHFWNALVSSPGNAFLLQGTAVVPPSSWTLHTLNANGIANLHDGLEDLQPYPEPLMPVTDAAVLAAQPPVTHGLVADGVTPLLMRIAASPVTEAVAFHLEYDYEGSGRLAGVTIGGSTTDGFAGRLKVLQNGEWRRVTDEASPLVLTPGEPEACFMLEALEPSDLTGLSPGDYDVVINLRAVATDLGADLATQSVKVRRPPLALVSCFPAEPWSPGFRAVLEESRSPTFIKSFERQPPNTHAQSVIEALSWGRDFRDQWAVTRIDAIAHGRGGLTIKDEFALSSTFRTEQNFHRGHFRRIIGLGVPHHGSELVFFETELVKRLSMEEQYETGAFLGINFFSLDKDLYYRRPVAETIIDPVDNIKTEILPSYDPAARWHDVGTVIDPDRSYIADYLGLDETRYNSLFPKGTDGLSAITDMDGNDGGLTLVSGFASHREPHEQHGGDSTQTSSPEVARHLLDLLDGTERVPFGRLKATFGKSLHRWYETHSVISEVFLSPALFIEAILLSSPTARTLSAPKIPTTSYRYAIDPPAEAPLTGKVTWIAETWTAYLATMEGLNVIPDPGDSTRVTVEIEDTVVGDTALFFSYPSTDGRLVFGKPLRVQHRSPAGASLVGIDVEPTDRTIQSGQTFRPEVTAVYSDGTRFLRWITADDLEVTSSRPDVVDVSDVMLWKAKAAGTSQLTVHFEGQTVVCELTVEQPAEALTFDQWRALFYSAEELADPAVSGADTDLDGDEMTVLLEYMVDGNPRIPDFGQAPVGAWMGSGSESTPALLARISSRISNYTLRVDRSLDLKTWETWYEMNGPPDETDPRVQAFSDALNHYKIIFDLAPEATGDSAYYRLKIVPAQVR